MKTLMRLTIFTGIALLTFVLPLHARFNVWEPENGIPVREGAHIRWHESSGVRPIAKNENDDFCVVWSATVDGAQNIFAQLYNSDCEAQWGEGGIQVTSSEWMQKEPRVTSAGEYGWYIGWYNWRIEDEEYFEASTAFQRVNPDGELMWDEDGLDLTPEGGRPMLSTHNPESIYPSDNDSFISIWYHDGGVVARRFDHNGSALWNDYVQIAPGYHTASSDGFSGVIILSYDYVLEEFSVNRVDADGDLLWGDAEEGIDFVNLDNTGYFDAFPVDLIPDGNGGAFAVFRGSADLNYQIYGQHVNSNGEIQWDIDGQLLVPDNIYESYSSITLLSPNNLALSWVSTNQYNNVDQLRVKRIESTDGEAIFHWGDEDYGMVLSDTLAFNNWLTPDGDGGVVAAWRASQLNNGDGEGYELQHLDSNGEIVWNSPRSSRAYGSYYSSATPVVVDDLAALIWRNPDIELTGIYLQAFDLNSGDQHFENKQTISEGLSGEVENTVIVRSGVSAYVCWEDSRFAQQGTLPFMQRVDFESGEAQWTANGINIVPGFETGPDIDARYRMSSLKILPDNESGVIANWMQSENEREYCWYFQRVDEDGNVLWGDQGYSIALEDEAVFWGGIAIATDDGGILLCYAVRDGYSSYKIIGQRLNSDREPQWNAPNGITLIESGSSIDLHKILKLDNGDLMLLITEPYNYQLYAMRISEDGELIWDNPVAVLQLDQQRSKLQAEVVDDYIVVFARVTNMGDGNRGYQAQCFHEDGELRWGNEGLAFASTQPTFDELQIAAGTDEDFWASWDRDHYYEVYHYDLDAELLTEEPVRVAEDARGRGDQELIPDGAGGVYFIWAEGRAQYPSNTDYLYIHLTGDNELARDEYTFDGIYLTDAPHIQLDINPVPDGEGGVLASWMDYREIITGHHTSEFNAYITRINDGTVGIKKEVDTNLPLNYSLESIYPNPFNPTTEIRIGLSHSAELRVTAYNILGQKITQLASGKYRAGYHNIVFNADEFSSGIYFIHANVPGKMDEVRKVVLLR
ncbi:MAG: T9SS type A sorting domain-containing protein [Candidatus Electryonea clarkiae]|nr:T9SS type A sorting domain-containing protein [Candidatus Electryonea clarkiae]MDP8288015.1 T9SS type A sorting domain-containing protein [Candidatus Electryonea clarkiae]